MKTKTSQRDSRGRPAAVGAQAAFAQDADRYRGGWRTGDDDLHIDEFSIRGEQVRSVCCTRDAMTLARIDGTLSPEGFCSLSSAGPRNSSTARLGVTAGGTAPARLSFGDGSRLEAGAPAAAAATHQ